MLNQVRRCFYRKERAAFYQEKFNSLAVKSQVQVYRLQFSCHRPFLAVLLKDSGIIRRYTVLLHIVNQPHFQRFLKHRQVDRRNQVSSLFYLQIGPGTLALVSFMARTCVTTQHQKTIQSISQLFSIVSIFHLRVFKFTILLLNYLYILVIQFSSKLYNPGGLKVTKITYNASS